MFSAINAYSTLPAYTQIENHVQFAIASGQLKEGDRLPAIREMAERMSVNPNTVAKAFRTLEIRGYIVSRRGLGTVVNDGAYEACRAESRKNVIGRLYEVVGEAKAAGFNQKELKQVLRACLEDGGGLYAQMPDNLLKI